MAIFHLSVHEQVKRSAGQSSLASAAYIMRDRLTDERTGQTYDYRHLSGAPLWAAQCTPKDAPEWMQDARQYWNGVEAFEKRSDALLAMPLDIALPHEMTLQQQTWLAQDYVRENFTRKGYVVLAAIHPPDHDERNTHLHLLVSLRKVEGNGFAKSKAEQQDNYRNRHAYVEELRENWERLANRHLERHGIDARIDRRSLREQGIERQPQKHRGPIKSAAIFAAQDRNAAAKHEADIKQATAQIIDLDARRAEREARAAARGQVDHVRPENSSSSTAAGRARARPQNPTSKAQRGPQHYAEVRADHTPPKVPPEFAREAVGRAAPAPAPTPRGKPATLSDGHARAAQTRSGATAYGKVEKATEKAAGRGAGILGRGILSVLAGLLKLFDLFPAKPPSPEQQKRNHYAAKEQQATDQKAQAKAALVRDLLERSNRDRQERERQRRERGGYDDDYGGRERER